MLNVSNRVAADGARTGELAPARSTAAPFDGWAVATLIGVAFAVAYWPVVAILRQQWATNDTYSFGVLVPFISGYLIWLRRERLTALPVRPSFWGAPIVLFAAAALLLGRLTAIVAFQEISLVLMLFGLVTLLLGVRFLRELWFPLAYLFLMLPIWEIVTDGLQHPSQLLSARLAHSLLQLVNIPVLREQEYLSLPNITLQVASACSGINFLIAVIAVGLPQAYLQLQGWVPRAAVMAFAVLIALLSNGLRVAIIGFLSYHGLSATVHGPGHMLQGLFVSGIGLVVLLASVNVLARWYPPQDKTSVTHEPLPVVQTVAGPRNRLGRACLAAVGILLSVALFRPGAPFAAMPSGATSVLPASDRWHELSSPAARFVSDGSGEPLRSRVFLAPGGERLELFVGNLPSRGRSGELVYRFVKLPPKVHEASQVVLPGTDLRVNRVVFSHAGRETHLIYWYDLNGRMTAQLALAKAHAAGRLAIGSGILPRLILVSMERPAGDHAHPALLTEFARDVASSLNPR